MIKYSKILIKISGESLSGTKNHGIDFEFLSALVKALTLCINLGAKIGIVVGGGNFWRGRENINMNRIKADKIGMLATVMNSIALCDEFNKNGINCEVQTACNMEKIANNYSVDRACKTLERDNLVIFGAGTGGPFFSTDTAAALRAAEISAQILIKATDVDGIFDSDPRYNNNVKRYKNLTFDEIISKKIKVMDTCAITLCEENNIPIRVCNIKDPYNICLVLKGEEIGTHVSLN